MADLNTFKTQKDLQAYADSLGLGNIFDKKDGLKEMRTKLYNKLHEGDQDGDSTKRAEQSRMATPMAGAHRTGNQEPITADTCLTCGVGSEVFTKYEVKREALDAAVYTYYKETTTGDVAHMTDDEKNEREATIKVALENVWLAWKNYLGYNEIVAPYGENMWVEKRDIEKLYGYMAEFGHVKKVGTQYTRASKGDFARRVEALVGMRMAIGTVLTLDERSVMDKFEKAQQSIVTCTNKLTGYTKNKEYVPSLEEQIKQVEKAIDGITEILRKAGVTDENVIETAVKDKRTQIKNLRSEIESAEKQKARAEQTVFELNPMYDAIIEKCKACDKLYVAN